MKQYIITLISLTALSLLSYSQVTSTGTSITGNDTASIVSNEFITLSNHAFADLEACNELADSLHAQNRNYELLKKKDEEIISNLEKSEKNLSAQVEAQSIGLELCEKNEAIQQRKITRMKIFRNILVAVIGVESGYIIINKLLSVRS